MQPSVDSLRCTATSSATHARVRRPGEGAALILIVALFATGTLAGCVDDAGSNEPLFERYPVQTQARVRVEVDYEAGAEPFTQGGLGRATWDLFESNAEALLADYEGELVIPKTLGEMSEISAEGDAFSVSDILAIADANRELHDSAEQKTYYIAFLDGHFERDGEADRSVLGVSIGNTGVIAIFKPVVGSGPSASFVEQATVIHEFGHAVGLVANGAPLTTAHHDEEHGAHCTNQDCVMYWANERASDLRDFISNFVLTGETVIFRDDCLGDVKAIYAE